MPPSRTELEGRWLRLVREELPTVASDRGWPIRNDHCFARVLLDNACGGCWYDHVAGRPAYRHASDELLGRALALGGQVLANHVDLTELNRRSLAWRGKLASLSGLQTDAAPPH
ncbi:GCN5-related N-acetyltransferase [Sphingomonas sp. BN140010]|uniref:GCN5-related N-acetyltransferase n=1 Tax=Sphingomonas arvum TaxID=2992113 RepID=A0ABT3JFM7_9SPHN|nr:GCN5-related N-acetyltransferase [Sphingomonas sp. BN140010]MCW3797880.1 GCN5-related N-acetyltransferase [Sphingomonas sp. BN140010]